MKKRKKRGLAWALSVALGFVCALVLGVLFYGVMVYQLGGQVVEAAPAQQATAAPLGSSAETASLFPGPLLSLPGEAQEESVRDELRGGELCRVVSRTYVVENTQVTAVSAFPAAYLAMLAEESFSPQLVTGFSLAGLDAVLERKGEVSMLAAREGNRVYLLAAQADEQTLYSLGAAAMLE
ncbi:MAG: hypothetical protein IKU34_12005 [Clostridia bacterium]|nr:hypothetical protein [Clostridia bacterium]